MENQFEQFKQIGIKIENVSTAIGTMARDGQNTHSNYSFTSNEKLMSAIRKHLPEQKLSVVSSVIDASEREFESGTGKTTIRSMVTMEFKVIDLETGFHLTERFVGADSDTGGKSMQQAITQCSKYFYFKLFKISSKDESDGDAATIETSNRRVEPQQATGQRTEQRATRSREFDDDVPDAEKKWLDNKNPLWNEVVNWAAKQIAMDQPVGDVRKRWKINKESFSLLNSEAKTIADDWNS